MKGGTGGSLVGRVTHSPGGGAGGTEREAIWRNVGFFVKAERYSDRH